MTSAFLPPDPSCLSLAPNTVQVWLLPDAQVERTCSALAHTLSPDEQERASRYLRQPHRQRFVARRGMLRWLIARYLGCRPESLRFRLDGLGKPALQRPAASALAFSVSQTEGLALLAFAWDCRLGVDVELLRDGVDSAGVGRDIFSCIEQKTLEAARPDSAAAFFRIWSRKEALLKALGTGLSDQSASYTTQDDLLQGEPRWRASRSGVPFTGWTFLDLALSPQVRAALAVSRPDAQVSLGLCALPAPGADAAPP
jgi:4'-phosphopantetheinyl transferase